MLGALHQRAQRLYRDTLRPLFLDYGDFDKIDIQNTFFAERIGRLFADPAAWYANLGTRLVQLADNHRIAREEEFYRQPTFVTEFTPEELQRFLGAKSLRYQPGEYGNREEYDYGMRRRDQTGVDPVTNQPLFTTSRITLTEFLDIRREIRLKTPYVPTMTTG